MSHRWWRSKIGFQNSTPGIRSPWIVCWIATRIGRPTEVVVDKIKTYSNSRARICARIDGKRRFNCPADSGFKIPYFCWYVFSITEVIIIKRKFMLATNYNCLASKCDWAVPTSWLPQICNVFPLIVPKFSNNISCYQSCKIVLTKLVVLWNCENCDFFFLNFENWSKTWILQ